MEPVIVATLLSPTIAVAVTLAYETYRRSREERLQLLRAFMVSRMHPADLSFVMAMNSIPLAFSRALKVLAAYKDCLEQLNAEEPRDDAKKQLHWEESNRRISTLMFRMMQILGFKTTEADVQRSGCTSRGFGVRDRLLMDAQYALLRIADAGERNTAILEEMQKRSHQATGTP